MDGFRTQETQHSPGAASGFPGFRSHGGQARWEALLRSPRAARVSTGRAAKVTAKAQLTADGGGQGGGPLARSWVRTPGPRGQLCLL